MKISLILIYVNINSPLFNGMVAPRWCQLISLCFRTKTLVCFVLFSSVASGRVDSLERGLKEEEGSPAQPYLPMCLTIIYGIQ